MWSSGQDLLGTCEGVDSLSHYANVAELGRRTGLRDQRVTPVRVRLPPFALGVVQQSRSHTHMQVRILSSPLDSSESNNGEVV